MKEETLEQVAEKYSKKSDALVFQRAHKQDFIASAEWQAERMYTEFEVLQLLLKFHQTEYFDNLYDWFQQNKKKQYGNC